MMTSVQDYPTQDYPSMKGFQAFYDRDLKPALDALEQERPAKVKSFFRITGITVAVGLALGFFMITNMGVKPGMLVFVGIGVLGICAWAYLPLSRLQKEAKLRTMNSLCDFLGLTYRLVPKGVSLRRLTEIDLIPSYHEKTLEDQIAGDVRGVDFSLFEAKLVRVSHDHKGRRRTTTVFRGLLCEFDFHKDFTGTTIITRDLSSFGNFFAKFGKIGERIRLEDPEFERQFEVYGTDQVESRYLLTPGFMERIRHLSHMVGRGNLQLAFDKGRLLLAIKKSENSFEGGSAFSDLSDISHIEKTLRELTLIYDVVDSLRLELETKI